MIPFSCKLSMVGLLPMNFLSLFLTLSVCLASDPCRDAEMNQYVSYELRVVARIAWWFQISFSKPLSSAHFISAHCENAIIMLSQQIKSPKSHVVYIPGV